MSGVPGYPACTQCGNAWLGIAWNFVFCDPRGAQMAQKPLTTPDIQRIFFAITLTGPRTPFVGRIRRVPNFRRLQEPLEAWLEELDATLEQPAAIQMLLDIVARRIQALVVAAILSGTIFGPFIGILERLSRLIRSRLTRRSP